MKKWQKEVLEMTKDEPLAKVFINDTVKKGLEENRFKVKELKKKKFK